MFEFSYCVVVDVGFLAFYDAVYYFFLYFLVN